MNVRLSSVLRLCGFTRSTPALQNGLTAFRPHLRRCYTSDKDDGACAPKNVQEPDDPQQKQFLDVTEYYSQYIKEYEQGGFKDEETVQWELRREKLSITRGRGETGVIDLEELVEFLRAERVRDICTLRMPKNSGNAPFLVLATPLSRRHLTAVTDKLRKAYKQKRAMYDPASIPIVDKTNQQWRVFDFGNAAVHLMLTQTRQKYDIEMLWAVGPELDDLSNSAGELDEYSDRLRKLQEEIESLSNEDSAQESEPLKEQA